MQVLSIYPEDDTAILGKSFVRFSPCPVSSDIAVKDNTEFKAGQRFCCCWLISIDECGHCVGYELHLEGSWLDLLRDLIFSPTRHLSVLLLRGLTKLPGVYGRILPVGPGILCMRRPVMQAGWSCTIIFFVSQLHLAPPWPLLPFLSFVWCLLRLPSTLSCSHEARSARGAVGDLFQER